MMVHWILGLCVLMAGATANPFKRSLLTSDIDCNVVNCNATENNAEDPFGPDGPPPPVLDESTPDDTDVTAVSNSTPMPLDTSTHKRAHCKKNKHNNPIPNNI
ncbi:uncharacterized protein LOC131928068 [Physella acuta]|uniref:uncharacterized protein LOC131928068 n=1 Tax=Physella acuta TaxID=109671 RepID=UPI0027DD0C31|nr:uncharacterized protein LOC131928068 [Physella acuta]